MWEGIDIIAALKVVFKTSYGTDLVSGCTQTEPVLAPLQRVCKGSVREGRGDERGEKGEADLKEYKRSSYVGGR